MKAVVTVVTFPTKNYCQDSREEPFRRTKRPLDIEVDPALFFSDFCSVPRTLFKQTWRPRLFDREVIGMKSL